MSILRNESLHPHRREAGKTGGTHLLCGNIEFMGEILMSVSPPIPPLHNTITLPIIFQHLKLLGCITDPIVTKLLESDCVLASLTSQARPPVLNKPIKHTSYSESQIGKSNKQRDPVTHPAPPPSPPLGS